MTINNFHDDKFSYSSRKNPSFHNLNLNFRMKYVLKQPTIFTCINDDLNYSVADNLSTSDFT